jgi:outer membrane protein TolC
MEVQQQGSRLMNVLLRTLVSALVALPGVVQGQAPLRLSLHDAIALARSQNAAAALAGIRAEEIEARVPQRKADLLPSVSVAAADGGRTYNTASFGLPLPGFDPRGSIIGPVRTVDLRARVSMNLYDPAARARYRGAQAVADSANFGHEAAMDAASLVAAAAYLRALRAEANVAARTADSANAAQLEEIAHAMLEAGVGVALDVTRAEAQSATGRSQMAAARTEQRQATLALRRALGVSLTQPLLLTDSLAAPSSPAPSESEAITSALSARPELRAAAAGVRSARLARNAATAGRLPGVSAFMDQGYTSSGWGNLLHTYAFGVQLSVPLLEGGRTEGRIDEQDAVLRAAELRQSDLTEQVSLEVRSALLDLSSAHEQVELARVRLRLAEAEVTQAQERFRAGVAGNADVIAALLALTSSRTQVIDAETSVRFAQVSLARAEGLISGIQ